MLDGKLLAFLIKRALINREKVFFQDCYKALSTK